MRNWLNSGISALRDGVICVPEIMPLFLQEGRLWWSPSLLAGLSKMAVGFVGQTTRLCSQFSSIFEEREHRSQLLHRPFQLRNRIRRKLLWLRQVLSVFDRFFLEPFEAGELELAILHYPDGEAPPAVFLRVAGLARVRYCAGICAASGRKALFFRGT